MIVATPFTGLMASSWKLFTYCARPLRHLLIVPQSKTPQAERHERVLTRWVHRRGRAQPGRTCFRLIQEALGSDVRSCR